MESSSDQNYIFGISEIEMQHDEIELELVSLQRAIGGSESGHVICSIFSQLEDRLATHFALEESVMHLFSLPETARHTAAHEDLQQLIGSCKRNDLAGLHSQRRMKQSVQRLVEQLHVHDKGFTAYLQKMRGFLEGMQCTNEPCRQPSNVIVQRSSRVDARHHFA